MNRSYSISFLLLIASLQGVSQKAPIESDITIQTDKGTLEATLLSTRKKHKAVLLIAGSGPTDRNGNSSLGMTNNSLKMLAEAISDAGITTLRYDKRIFSKDSAAKIPEEELRFERLVLDAKAGIQFLKDQGYKGITVAGHSQGALVAMLAALDNPSVDGVISIAGASQSVDAIMLEQIGKQAPVLVDPLKVKLDSLKEGHFVTLDNPFLQPILRSEIQGFLQSYMAYAPTEVIGKLPIPILIVNGTTDIQVTVNEANALASAAMNGNLQIIEGMNHVLKPAPADLQANMMTYDDPDLDLAEGLTDSIIEFLKKL